jgi:hypothetical protein
MSWWAIINQYDTPDFSAAQQARPHHTRIMREDIKRRIDNDPYFLVDWGMVTGKAWAKDEPGFSKYKELMGILDSAPEGVAPPAWVKENFISENEMGYEPKYWNNSSWNINELDDMIMLIHGAPGVFK